MADTTVQKSFVEELTKQIISKQPSDLFFSIGNPSQNPGYTNQAKALAKKLAEAKGQSKQVENIDLASVEVDELLTILKERKAKEGDELKKITLVSSGSFGLPFFNAFAKKLKEMKLNIAVEYQYTTDRYFEIPKDLEDSSWLKNLYITSVDTKGFNFERFENKPITLKTDLVQVDPENIQQQSKDFKTKNPEVCKEIEEFEHLKENGIAFIGGRVQKQDGSWIENNPEVFVNTAKFLMSQGVRVFATHGLRSFTKSDKTNNFAAINAFYDIIKEKLSDDESAYIFTQEEKDDKTTRTPVLKKITKQAGKTIDECSKNTDIIGNPYNYLLCLADDQKLPIYPTIEQTTLASEAVAVGVKPEKIIPLGEEQKWTLFVESNLEAYDFTKQQEESLTPFDAIQKHKQRQQAANISRGRC